MGQKWGDTNRLADRLVSPAGDRRERAVPCQQCLHRTTWNIDAICDGCADSRAQHPATPRPAA